jgi:hypothetical protein
VTDRPTDRPLLAAAGRPAPSSSDRPSDRPTDHYWRRRGGQPLLTDRPPTVLFVVSLFSPFFSVFFFRCFSFCFPRFFNVFDVFDLFSDLFI